MFAGMTLALFKSISMKEIIISIVAVFSLIGCSNNSPSYAFMEKQIDNDIIQTEKYIKEELNHIEKTHAIGLGESHEDFFGALLESSKAVEEISSLAFSSQLNLDKNKEKIKNTYLHHVLSLIDISNNDARAYNDYLAPSFKSIIGGSTDMTSIGFNNFMDSLMNTGSDDLNRIQLKLTYSHLKKAEHKAWNCMNTYYKGFGVKSRDFKGFVKIENTVMDSISGILFTGAFPASAITKIHFGKIDSSGFQKKYNYSNYRAGTKFKVPLIGPYTSQTASKKMSFKIDKKELIGKNVEGVIEIRYSEGTVFIPFKQKVSSVGRAK